MATAAFVPPKAVVRRKPQEDAGSDEERAQLIGDILQSLYGDKADDFVDDLDETGESKGLPWYCTKAWSSVDHPRGQNGRFIPKNSPEALSAAHKQIKEAAAQPKTPQSLKALTEHLSILTVAQLKALNREHGLKGGVKAKAELVAKIAEKLQASGKPAEPEKPRGVLSNIDPLTFEQMAGPAQPGSPNYKPEPVRPNVIPWEKMTQEMVRREVEADRAMQAERKKKQAERARELFGSWATGEMPEDQADEASIKPKAAPFDAVTAALAGKEKLHSRDVLASLEKNGLTPTQAIDALKELQKQGKISISRTDTGKWQDVRLKTSANAGTPFVLPKAEVRMKKITVPEAAAKVRGILDRIGKEDVTTGDIAKAMDEIQHGLDKPQIDELLTEMKIAGKAPSKAEGVRRLKTALTQQAEMDVKYGPGAQERRSEFSTVADAAKATKQLHDSMSTGSTPHGGYEGLKAKVDAHLEKLAKLSKSGLDEVWHGGLGKHLKIGTKGELLKKIGQEIMARAGSYDRRNA